MWLAVRRFFYWYGALWIFIGQGGEFCTGIRMRVKCDGILETRIRDLVRRLISRRLSLARGCPRQAVWEGLGAQG